MELEAPSRSPLNSALGPGRVGRTAKKEGETLSTLKYEPHAINSLLLLLIQGMGFRRYTSGYSIQRYFKEVNKGGGR